MRQVYRIIGAIICVGLIIGMSTYLYLNKDTAFKTHMVITYADGCKEYYIGDNLTSPICDEGRRIDEWRRHTIEGEPVPWANITINSSLINIP